MRDKLACEDNGRRDERRAPIGGVLQFTCKVSLRDAPDQTAPIQSGRVPRIARLMALAIHCDDLVHRGLVRDQAQLARLGHVSQARISQILGLASLAPDIQQEILFLPRTERGRDPIRERHLRPLTRVLDWATQRRMWAKLKWRWSE